jgi:hypothetical protein
MRRAVLALTVLLFTVGFSSPLLCQGKPKKVLSKDEEMLEDIEVIVKVPKPEAQIFTPKMKTRYETLTYQKSFVQYVLDRSRTDRSRIGFHSQKQVGGKVWTQFARHSQMVVGLGCTSFS